MQDTTRQPVPVLRVQRYARDPLLLPSTPAFSPFVYRKGEKRELAREARCFSTTVSRIRHFERESFPLPSSPQTLTFHGTIFARGSPARFRYPHRRVCIYIYIFGRVEEITLTKRLDHDDIFIFSLTSLYFSFPCKKRKRNKRNPSVRSTLFLSLVSVVLLDTTQEEKLEWTKYPFGAEANTPGVSFAIVAILGDLLQD